MRRIFSVVLLGWVVVLPGPSLAEEEANEDETQYTMDTVFVSSTKTEEKRKDIPNAVVYKDAFDIDESPANGLGDFLGGELGVDWRTRGNYGGAAEEIHLSRSLLLQC